MPMSNRRCILPCSAPVISWIFLLIPPAYGQTTPINPPPGWKQVPQGEGACSVEKSCAELAPTMIRSALGPSPLEENLRYLTDSIGGRMTGSPEADRAAGWAVEAFRHAGVDEVHTEAFTVPAELERRTHPRRSSRAGFVRAATGIDRVVAADAGRGHHGERGRRGGGR